MRREKTAERRAERLLLAYPKAWRSRYGQEFVELLMADISDRRRSWRRSVDVVRVGGAQRLAHAGLASSSLDADEHLRASLGSLVCCVAVFVYLGGAMWSQLTTGWQWSEPDTTATTVATVVTSVAVIAFVLLALLAAAPVGWKLVHRVAQRRDARLVLPAALLFLGAAAFFAGGRHFANGWPGTGGHHWAHQGLVPGGLAAFSWAATLSVSSYWLHPTALGSFPPSELAWMAVSPLAVTCILIGAAKAARRLDLSAHLVRFETGLAMVAWLVMVVFLGACFVWIVDGGAGPGNLFHAGAIDAVAVAVMTALLGVAQRAINEARRARSRLDGPTDARAGRRDHSGAERRETRL